MAEPVKLFIVEGESRDYRFVKEMTKCFLKGRYKTKVINLPAAQNIYMLYQKLAEDDFETDVVEVLRDTVKEADKILDGISRQDIDEIYLFFDYDIHQNNLKLDFKPSKIINDMFKAFNNETENGRLYISYPMVEALYDYRAKECSVFSNCFIHLNKVKDYKKISSENNPNASKRFEIEEWKDAINVFYLRVKCLFNLDSLDYETYREIISPESIYKLEENIVETNDQVFILSAFPEFLLDYFKSNFFNSMTSIKKPHYTNCPRNYQP